MNSVRYAFTVTLKPNLYRFTPTEQYDMTYYRIHTILWSVANEYTCVAELTQNGNIHYHGIIDFIIIPNKSNMIRFKNSFRKETLFGFNNIKQIDNDLKWIEYISKDLKTTKEEIDRPPIIKDEFKVILHPTLGNYLQDLE